MPDVSDKKSVQLKGHEAEEAVLKYLKRVNRPYGAADVSANLKGAVTKPMTQKILATLAEKSLITQKAYGKTNIYLANPIQEELEDVPDDKLKLLGSEYDALMEQVKIRTSELKAVMQELSRIRSAPTDDELVDALAGARQQIDAYDARLAPLRTGAPPISADELAQLEREYARWKGEWVRRRKIFAEIWDILVDSMSPQEAADFEDELGIERDSEQDVAVLKRL